MITHHNTEPFENTSLYYYNECTRSAEPLPYVCITADNTTCIYNHNYKIYKIILCVFDTTYTP